MLEAICSELIPASMPRKTSAMPPPFNLMRRFTASRISGVGLICIISTGILVTTGIDLALDAIYSAEIDGTTAGADYSQLDVDGPITLDGTLSLNIGGLFRASAGDVFTLIHNETLDPVADQLRGRTLVNVTTTTPNEARELAAWAAGHGFAYLDGAILAVPAMIGSPDARIFYSGARTAFERYRDGYKLPLDANASVRGSRTGELIARCMVETGTSSYYTALGEATTEPVLKQVCKLIAADEGWQNYAAIVAYINSSRGGLLEVMSANFDVASLRVIALMRRAGRVIPRDALLAEAGRSDVVVGERTVDVHISHLRAKLGDDPRSPRRIKTVRGVGYVLSREQ